MPGVPLRALAMSGHGRHVDAVRAREAGFDAHIAKPASIEQIKQLLAQLPPRASDPMAALAIDCGFRIHRDLGPGLLESSLSK